MAQKMANRQFCDRTSVVVAVLSHQNLRERPRISDVRPLFLPSRIFSARFLSGVPRVRFPCSLPGPLAGLFPLDRALWFGSDIVNHSLHAVHFVDATRGD